MEDHKTETFIYVVQQSNKQQEAIRFKRRGAGQPKTPPRSPGATGGTGKTAKAPKCLYYFLRFAPAKARNSERREHINGS